MMKIATLLLLLPLSSAFAQQVDVPEITLSAATVEIPTTGGTKAPKAKGIDLVDGAIVCTSHDLASFVFGEINAARHARRSLPPDIRKQAALMNGYDPGEEPKAADYGCVLVPTGTPLSIERGNFVPVVSGRMPDGRRFNGVTLTEMISR